MNMPPKTRTIVPPAEGWKDQTYYVVDVAFIKNNPIHRAIFCSGFITAESEAKGHTGYRYILSNSQEDGATPLECIHYMKVICEIKEMGKAQ